MKTSVTIACYNCEKTISLCLDSVLANNPGEVIVVNDCSTDGSREILKKYPVKVIDLPENSGVAKAEKIGIENSTGDVIFITNADIVVPPNWIKRHLELHREADCVGSWVRHEVEFGVSDTLSIPATNCSFKRKVLDKIGNIDETLISGSEEIEFFLRARAHNFRILHDSSIPVLHYHPVTYKQMLKKQWNYGYRLGRLIRTYPHGKLMSRSFLLLPAYWLVLVYRRGKKFLTDLTLDVTESIAKFIGYITYR